MEDGKERGRVAGEQLHFVVQWWHRIRNGRTPLAMAIWAMYWVHTGQLLDYDKAQAQELIALAPVMDHSGEVQGPTGPLYPGEFARN